MKRASVLAIDWAFFTGGSDATVTLAITPEGRQVIRKSAPLGSDRKLRSQAAWLKAHEHIDYLPRVLDTAESGGYFVVDLEFYSGFEPFLAFIERAPVIASAGILTRIVDEVSNSLHAHKLPAPDPFAVNRYIEIKIVKKLAEAAALRPEARDLIYSSELVINGESYRGVLEALHALGENKAWKKSVRSSKSCDIHGDLTVENIIVKGNDFVLLDPNDENIISDPCVEFAKLFQSFHSGYEYLAGIPEPALRGRELTVHWPQTKKYDDLLETLKNHLRAKSGEACLEIIAFHEAVHFSRLLPYRAAKTPKLFLAYFARFVTLINQVLKEAAK